MDNGMPMGGPPMGPQGQGPAPAGQGEDKQAVEAQLLQLLNEAQKIAASKGIDFKQIVMKFVQGGPRPPMPPMGGKPPMGPPPGGPAAPPMP